MKKSLGGLVIAAALLSHSALADDRFAGVEIDTQAVSGSVHMLVGAGGNIGVSAGKDGILIVDDQFAPLADKISAELDKLGSGSPKFIINTHYHGDHTGSNAVFNEKHGSTIFAHENVRIRLASAETPVPAALPVVTYQDGLKFHFNDETIHVFHLFAGHTDGDSAVWFENANVVHTGDLFFKDTFPYIDLGAGGTVEGYMASVSAIISRIDDDTKIIPGHGSLATKQDYQLFLNMIQNTHAYVQGLKLEGKTLDEVLAIGLDEKWDAWSWQFINEERWIRTLY